MADRSTERNLPFDPKAAREQREVLRSTILDLASRRRSVAIPKVLYVTAFGTAEDRRRGAGYDS